MEPVRFASSGTEANLMAMTAAQLATGIRRVVHLVQGLGVESASPAEASAMLGLLLAGTPQKAAYSVAAA